MGLARFVEGTAFGVLNNILGEFNSEDGGYAVPNRFEVIIISPAHDSTNAKKVSLRCESVTLPGRNLNTTTDSNIYGPTREIVNGVTYAEDITMTFQASSELGERAFFEEWQEKAFDERTWDVGYYKHYHKEIEIYLLDRQNLRRYGIKLMEAFPKTINATELGQGINNEVIKLGVVFTFRYWTTLDTNRTPKKLTDKIFDTIKSGVERQLTSNLPNVFKLF